MAVPALTPDVLATRQAVRATLAGLPSGAVVLVACSGGADSLALAAAAVAEGARLGHRVGGVTIDHGLQPGSERQAQRVAETLRALGLDPVEVVTVSVGDAGGPEAAARAARYEALDSLADELDATVLLGHSLDDQAETVLLGLARGSGARSLSGMSEASGRYRRPLLGLRRAQLARACADLGLTPWQDPHNRDPRFTRARLRHEALPVLEAVLGPGVAPGLARTARLLRDDADALDLWAARARDQCALPDGSLDAGQLATFPAAVRRRVLRLAALAAGAAPGALAASHLRALDALVADWHGQGPVSLPSGVEGRRSCGRLLVGGAADRA